MVTKERYKSGSKKGELKWKTSIRKSVDYLASFVSRFSGIPYDTLKKLSMAPVKKRTKKTKGRIVVNDILKSRKPKLGSGRLKGRLKGRLNSRLKGRLF